MSLTFGVRGRLTSCKASPETSSQYHRQHFSPRNVRNDSNDNFVPLHNNSNNLIYGRSTWPRWVTNSKSSTSCFFSVGGISIFIFFSVCDIFLFLALADSPHSFDWFRTVSSVNFFRRSASSHSSHLLTEIVFELFKNRSITTEWDLPCPSIINGDFTSYRSRLRFFSLKKDVTQTQATNLVQNFIYDPIKFYVHRLSKMH